MSLFANIKNLAIIVTCWSDGSPAKMYGIVTKLVFLEQGFFYQLGQTRP